MIPPAMEMVGGIMVVLLLIKLESIVLAYGSAVKIWVMVRSFSVVVAAVLHHWVLLR
ncbi:hypothetical protein D3C71_1957950 [compost metagenome]